MAAVPAIPRAVCLAVLTACLVTALSGCEQPPPRKPAGTGSYDADTLAALAVANEFCEAWRRRDVAAGKVLLSGRANRAYSEARIHDALAGAPSPRHEAFEVFSAERSGEGAIAFRVRLHYRFLGQAQERIESRAEKIVLTREQAGAWRVDRFPLLTDP